MSASKQAAAVDSVVATKPQVARPVQLDRDAVYLSPTGRRCRWIDSDAPTAWVVQATFLYDLPGGERNPSLAGDSFSLSQANWHLLRRMN